MRRLKTWSILFCLIGSMSIGLIASDETSSAADLAPISFQRDIRPLLSDHCFACHGPDEQKRESELRLDQFEGAMNRGALVPGDSEESLVWQRISSDDPETLMPPPHFNKPLNPTQRELIRRWIESGAEFQQHWAFVAPQKPTVPANGEENPIDAFLLQRLQKDNLRLSRPADPRTLIRRITLDLTGLPPTPADVEAFVADKSDDAVTRLIESLMSRVSYGEHMARYWLDLARYADTHGLHLDNERSMWPYRDWVVRAFQQNIPFDEFTRWQLAGDLLDNPTREQLIASGFNRCNVTTSEGGSIAEEWVYRYAVDRTTTAAEVWMGLTAGCAVCHDHKFDPLSTREYYSMYAFFHSAADPAMDGNKVDTPPILKLRSDDESQKIAALNRKLTKADRDYKKAISEFDYVDPGEQDPPPPMRTLDSVWFEDAFPSGAKLQNTGEALMLIDDEQGPVFSGKFAVRRKASGLGQDNFNEGAEAMVFPTGGKIFVQCFLDPDDPPETIMLQFHTDGWKHRAVWGAEEKIGFGKANTPEKFLAGELPATGQWVELEINPAKVGLKAGSKITGFAFTQFGGTVTWDQLCVRSKIDTANDPTWSYKIWKDRNAAKPVKELPDDLKEIVRSKKIEDWTEKEAQRIFEQWLEKIYVDDDQALKSFKDKKTSIAKEIEAVDANVPFTFVMADLPKSRESFVMIRGAYDKPGEKVTRQVPSFLPPLPAKIEGSEYDRLDLANWLVSGAHPLTARVTVNRLWQQFFGTGLVKTSSDFGSQGEPPSHPELLDWLAVQFVEDGWDVQRFAKRILTSKAYRQSSAVTEALLQHDPENRLLARGPRFRLDAEIIRDQALFVSGLLVDEVGGKGVKPYQPPNIWEPVGFGNSNTRNYTQGSGDELYRRSLYTFLKRTAPPPFMSTFDAPNREQSCANRERSNTPLQALQLMNDIQHVEAARNFAQRILLEGGKQPKQRVRWAWQIVTGRYPNGVELKMANEFLAQLLKRYDQDKESAKQLVGYGESKADASVEPSELAAYTLLANLILNLDESISKN
ncbi:MAG: PSD1 and planctomycete cytochrome C domain-containing protein [Pirellulaceae bacterium]|nr:PSD1 and planctomycete cytochrome C domain-containing protein [Pirellulaceae bacterium]